MGREILLTVENLPTWQGSRSQRSGSRFGPGWAFAEQTVTTALLNQPPRARGTETETEFRVVAVSKIAATPYFEPRLNFTNSASRRFSASDGSGLREGHLQGLDPHWPTDLLALRCLRVPASTIPVGYWLWFCGFVVTALAIDLGLFHRKGRETSFRGAVAWTSIWVAVAMAFGFGVAPQLVPGWTSESSATFLTGYVVELSLSMDNVFVIALVFAYFKVPSTWQHRVLFWGILGALVLRGVMIWVGSELVTHFHWILYAMGAFLVMTGVKMLFSSNSEDGPPDLSRNLVVRLAHRFLPVAREFDGERFVTQQSGRRLLTPLAVVLMVVETTDVVFAVDSIPAIFGITDQPFLIFTSNVFAILGLRSLYFVLASAMGYFRFLKVGLAWVLVMIGAKMLTEQSLKAWLGERLTNVSLAVVVGIIAVSVAASLYVAWRDQRLLPPPS